MRGRRKNGRPYNHPSAFAPSMHSAACTAAWLIWVWGNNGACCSFLGRPNKVMLWKFSVYCANYPAAIFCVLRPVSLLFRARRTSNFKFFPSLVHTAQELLILAAAAVGCNVNVNVRTMACAWCNDEVHCWMRQTSLRQKLDKSDTEDDVSSYF